MKDVSKMKVKEMLEVLVEAVDLGQHYKGDFVKHLSDEDRDERYEELEEHDDKFRDAYKVIIELRKRLR